MRQLFRGLLWTFARLVLRLRYRVQVVGLEALGALEGPTLIMPNHPGYIDPPLVLSHVRLGATVRPLVFAGTYRNRALYPIMRAAGALEVPDLGEHSRGARERTLTMIDAVVEGLEQGESFLIYPSGRLQRRGSEVVGAARAASEILERCPHVNVVLVRTRGVWGSMFSFAQTGEYPDLGKCTLRAMAWIALNLLFFAPRREVTMCV
ncbi:MAG: lysophospholipid acyltransferase family protein, partial [Planctomycetota bacterium]